MTPGEWDDILTFVEEQWPGQWRPQQAISYYRQLADFDAVDVWGALQKLYDKGRDFAPNGSILKSATLEERRVSYRDRVWDQPQLDAPTVKLADVIPTGLWEEAIRLHRTYERGIPESYTPYQFTVNIPVEKWPKVCLSPLCKEHQ